MMPTPQKHTFEIWEDRTCPPVPCLLMPMRAIPCSAPEFHEIRVVGLSTGPCWWWYLLYLVVSDDGVGLCLHGGGTRFDCYLPFSSSPHVKPRHHLFSNFLSSQMPPYCCLKNMFLVTFAAELFHTLITATMLILQVLCALACISHRSCDVSVHSKMKTCNFIPAN